MSASQATRSRSTSTAEPISDIDAYIASLPDERRQGLALAQVAVDLIDLLAPALDNGDQAEPETSEHAERRRQAMRHFERHGVMARLGALQTYLHELGYALELNFVALDTGESAGRLTLPTEAAD